MKILAIESTAKAASCAAYIDGELRAFAFQDAGLTHSKTLMPMVRDMLANASLDLRDFEYVAAAHGPGSFTGVRIGVATALGLAAGAGSKAVGVSTLEAMSRLLTQNGVFEGFVALAAMDARRGEVYAAAFDGGKRITEDVAEPAGEFCERVLAKNPGKTIICIGDGAKLCYNYLSERGVDVRLAPPHLAQQNAAGVAYAAEALIASGAELPPLRPVYLRMSQAERERLARENNV